MTAELRSACRWLLLLVALASNLLGALIASFVETVRELIGGGRPELTPDRSAIEPRA